ncbi:hypothetical protein LP7551_00497 [Roseibium album]|jgi:hypothetical protein|nr:hypothetical protein LP7551_00497 [Roseibium album]
MFGFVNVVGATLRESTRTAQGKGSKALRPEPTASKLVKAKA